MDLAACTLGMMMMMQSRMPKMDIQQRNGIAYYVCAAAEHEKVSPAILGAYMLNENSQFKMTLVRPAATGFDVGLFQHNTRYNGGVGQENLQRLAHPYTGAVQTAKTIKLNISRHGFTWRAFAAYWSPKQSLQETQKAKEYFNRLRRHHDEVNFYLAKASQMQQLARK
jgi:hypothetical protein